MSPREAFLDRVKSAVAEGNRVGTAPPLPQRSGVGYQGAGADPVQRFCTELASAGGKGYVASDDDSVIEIIQNILKVHNAQKVILSRGGLVERLNLGEKLTIDGVTAIAPHANGIASTADSASAKPQAAKEEFFAADVGITNVHRLIAETGSVVLASRPNEPRSLSLLPPVHICLAERSQILPDLFDLFDLFSPTPSATQSLPPSCLTVVTGPSKTGDIELKLVTGVHGPGEIHVIVCNW